MPLLFYLNIITILFPCICPISDKTRQDIKLLIIATRQFNNPVFMPVSSDNTLFQFIYLGNSNRFFLFFLYFLCVSFDTFFDIFIPFKCYCTQSVPKIILSVYLPLSVFVFSPLNPQIKFL